jgi:uroporphyrinogen-III synthase
VRVLLTRPQPDGERTAAALRARGHTVVLAPLLRIEPLADAPLDGAPWTAILVTSANAAAAIGGHARVTELRALPVLTVGARSAQEMRAAGFKDVSSADGDAQALAALALARLPRGVSLLYLAGVDRSGDLAAALSPHGFRVNTAAIYRAVATDALPAAAADALAEGVGGVLHFSRRSAQTFVDTAQRAGLGAKAFAGPAHFCLSAQVAQPLQLAGAAGIHIAATPREDALLALVDDA